MELNRGTPLVDWFRDKVIEAKLRWFLDMCSRGIVGRLDRWVLNMEQEEKTKKTVKERECSDGGHAESWRDRGGCWFVL